MCSITWFVSIQSPLLRIGKVTPFRHFTKQVVGILDEHGTSSSKASIASTATMTSSNASMQG
jgi:hypothetical protein